MPDPKKEQSYRGLYRGGLVRLLEETPWEDGCEVEVRLVKPQPSPEECNIGQVLVAGYGLAGRWVVQVLDRHGIDYTLIEQNEETVRRQLLLGKNVVLGSVSLEQTLVTAGVENASILALTIPDEKAVLKATHIARRLNPKIYIVARTMYTSAGMEASQLGADAVVKAEQAVAYRFYELLLHKIQEDSRQ